MHGPLDRSVAYQRRLEAPDGSGPRGAVTGCATTEMQIWLASSPGELDEPPFRLDPDILEPSQSFGDDDAPALLVETPAWGGSKQRRTCASRGAARDRISGDTSVLDSGSVVITRWSRAKEPGRSGSTVKRSWNVIVREPRRTINDPEANVVRAASLAKALRGTENLSRSGAMVASPRQVPITRTGGGPEPLSKTPVTSTWTGGSSSPDVAKSGA